MEILALFFRSLAYVLNVVLELYFWIIIISALLTWVRPDPYNPIVRFLTAVTEPVFRKVRQLLPFLIISGFDLTPIVLLFGIQFLKMFLVGSLMRFGSPGLVM